MMRRPFLAASLVVLLGATVGGCAPEIQTAARPIAPAALGLAGPAAPQLDARWWQMFGDPQLDRIVDDALAGSPTLDEALARLRQAQAGLTRQRAGLNPTASVYGDVFASRNSRRFIGGDGPDKVEGIGLVTGSLTWNIDLFGRQHAAIREAGAAATAAGLDVAAARLALAGSIAQTYVDLTRAEAQAAIARDTIGTRERSLHLVQVQERNRLASKLQITAAETLLAQARQSLEAATRVRLLAADALAALAGRGADYAAGIGASRLSLAATPALPTALPADLLGRRPDVAAARARVEAASAGVTVARKAYYPNVNLLAFAGLQSIGLGHLLSLDAGTAGAGAAVSLPLFEGGKLKAGLVGATADLDLATARYNGTLVGAVRDTADAINAIQSLDRERRHSRDVVGGFAETQRLNGIRVRSGLESRLDIVDTDIRLLDARLADITLAAAEADQRIALIVALGGGFAS